MKMGVEISASISKAIAVVVITLVLLVMTDPIVDQVDAVNTTNWSFTGHEGAEVMLGLIPFIWIASVLGSASYAMFRIVKGD